MIYKSKKLIGNVLHEDIFEFIEIDHSISISEFQFTIFTQKLNIGRNKNTTYLSACLIISLTSLSESVSPKLHIMDFNSSWLM